jgi:hypothetical protein
MHFLRQYYPLLALVLGSAVQAIAATHVTDSGLASQDVSCRCGSSDFLTLPHANLSKVEPADKCFAYRS